MRHAVRARRRAAVGVLLAAVAAGLLAACGGGARSADVEADVAGGLADRLHTAIASVRCPDDLPTTDGETYTCTAFPTDGTPVAITVTVTDGGRGYEWQSDLQQRSGAELAAEVQAQLREQFADAGINVTCPETVVVVEGDSVSCQATDSSGLSSAVTVTLEGDSFTFEVQTE